MVWTGERTTDECPRCNSKNEHTEHIIQCRDKDTDKTFWTAFTEVDFWLQKTTTGEIESAITDLIFEYSYASESLNNYRSEISKAMNRQWSIGLFAFMCRLMCWDRVNLQTTLLQQIGSRKCPTRWVAQLAEKLIAIIFDMWNHWNENLHKQTNTITEQKHKQLNEEIHQIYDELPNMRLLMASERQFFKFKTAEQVQERNIHRNGQWIWKAESIMRTFETKQNSTTTGDVQTLIMAMGKHSIRTNTQQQQEQNTNTRSTQFPVSKSNQTTKTKTKTTSITQYMSNISAHNDSCKFKDLRWIYYYITIVMQVCEPACMSVQFISKT